MIFEPSLLAPDTDETRTCGNCQKSLPTTSFYRDGSSKGVIKYRRDCKDCYRKSRLMGRRAKKRRKK